MVSVGDQVKLLQDQNGRSVACQSSSPAVGDTGVVLQGSDGKMYFHKSGTPSVGDQVLIVQSQGGMKYALCSAAAAAPIPTYGVFAVGYGSRMDGATRYGQIWVINTSLGTATMVLEKEGIHIADVSFICYAGVHSAGDDSQCDDKQLFCVLYWYPSSYVDGIPKGPCSKIGVAIVNRKGDLLQSGEQVLTDDTTLNRDNGAYHYGFIPRFMGIFGRSVGSYSYPYGIDAKHLLVQTSNFASTVIIYNFTTKVLSYIRYLLPSPPPKGTGEQDLVPCTFLPMLYSDGTWLHIRIIELYTTYKLMGSQWDRFTRE